MREWRPCDDEDSDRDDTANSDSDGDPVLNKGMSVGPTPVAAPAAATPSSPLADTIVWGLPFGHAGYEKQACPVCFKFFSCGANVRPDCVDRARKYAIMSHSIAKGGLRHIALAKSIAAADPNINNFRTSQVAPGCVAGPETWTFHNDDQWARYFGQYDYFKKKPLRTQQNLVSQIFVLVLQIGGKEGVSGGKIVLIPVSKLS